MSGLFQIFSVSKNGMFAQQTALHTNAHNIANANTDGYSVQRVNLKTTEPFGMPALTTPAEPGQLGTGVKVDSITRARDTFLDAQIRKENSTQGKYGVREQFLSEIESIFMEPSDEGLASSLTKFWDSWHQLATNPESSTARTLVAQNGDALATDISHHYTQLEDMERNAGDLIRNDVFDVASTLTQIRDLNEQIRAVSISGRNPNDLMDRRDLLLDNLS
ncbi:MAG TPA: flagellar hook-associated protein FlgK, partial [Clostridiaceae bacterium]|nr:flagellar hook-associated protein FlgK [Clostridiaceae bacterium]HBG37856.1 flagellar hook-associated protein FlgK [Clostridiaceae bacterium]